MDGSTEQTVKLKKFACPKCGSNDVGYDATSRFDVSSQEWVLNSMFDQGWCNDCGEVEPMEIDLDEEDLKLVEAQQRST